MMGHCYQLISSNVTDMDKQLYSIHVSKMLLLIRYRVSYAVQLVQDKQSNYIP